MKLLLRLAGSLAPLAAFAIAFGYAWPNARDAGALFAAQDDPVLLSQLQVRKRVAADPGLVDREIEAALKDGDTDLAQSFVDLAQAERLPVSVDLLSRLEQTVAEQRSASHLAGRFATGLLTGDTDDLASFSGTVVGDLFAYGDIRDVVIQGKRLAVGEEADRLVLGLGAA